MPTWLDILVLSIVEGITEFLPVSSTGHMIITERIFSIPGSEALDAFLVIVQMGAILAVISVFWRLFLSWAMAWWRALPGVKPAPAVSGSGPDPFLGGTSGDGFLRKQSLCVASAVIPFGLLGFALHKHIGALFSVPVVAWALIVGGVLMWVSEFLFRPGKDAAEPPRKTLADFSFRDALLVGCGQCLALWPGFSRSAATLITGRFMGYGKEVAAELSFIIGLPTLVGAASFEMIKEFHKLDGTWFSFLAFGIVISWVVAYFCVKGFILFLKRYSLNIFSYYRIVVGVALLAWFGPSA